MFEVHVSVVPVPADDVSSVDGTIRLIAKQQPAWSGEAGNKTVVGLAYRFDVPTIERAIAIKSMINGVPNAIAKIKEK